VYRVGPFFKEELSMEIWKTNELLLFVGFAIPGFVSLKTYSLLVPAEHRDSASQVMDAVAYSCVNYALLLVPIYWVDSIELWESQPALYLAFAVVVLLAAPIGWAFLYKWLRGTPFFRRNMPHPTGKPWDYVFGRNIPYWVIVKLNDGSTIAGRYDTESFASSAPAGNQLYLEEAWVLNADGGFERARHDTAGIMILSEEMATIEFFKISYGAENVGSRATD
jgi:hypothetical protein